MKTFNFTIYLPVWILLGRVCIGRPALRRAIKQAVNDGIMCKANMFRISIARYVWAMDRLGQWMYKTSLYAGFGLNR